MEISRRAAGYPQLNVRVPPELLASFKAAVAAATAAGGGSLTLASVTQELIEGWMANRGSPRLEPTSALLQRLTWSGHRNRNVVVVDDADFTISAVAHLVDSRRSTVDVVVVNAVSSLASDYAALARAFNAPVVAVDVAQLPRPLPITVVDVAGASDAAVVGVLNQVHDLMVGERSVRDRFVVVVFHGIKELTACGPLVEGALRTIFRDAAGHGAGAWMTFHASVELPAYDDVLASLSFHCELLATTNPELTRLVFEHRVDRPGLLSPLGKRGVLVVEPHPSGSSVYRY